MTVTAQAAHAKHRAPSAAKRWLSCPYTAVLIALYPSMETEQSLKGDFWHEVMEDTIRFNCIPKYADPDVEEAMQDLLAYVRRRCSEMKGPVHIYVEERVDIPETGEFGTVDIILVGANEIEIIDEKSGYVPVSEKMNAQMLTYLCGVVELYGRRGKYRLTIHQPNYDHIDGPIRSFDCTDEELDWHRQEIKYSMNNPDEVKAGKHCKDTYCPHRGSCSVFAEYVKNDLSLGWHTSELVSMSDEDLSTALDAADELSGWRNSLRAEALKRIMNMDRKIHGYKVVKGRKQRAIHDPLRLVLSIRNTLGIEWLLGLFSDLEWIPDAESVLALATSDNGVPDALLKQLGTAKQVEDLCKKYAQVNGLPRGGWKGVYENVAGPYIRETHSGLTLEKAIDGRPAHKRGSEFGPIANPGTVSII